MNAEVLKCATAMYEAVPEEVRENIGLAHAWALDTLMRHEGAGHLISVTGSREGGVICSFAKPEWSGDHSGSAMYEAAEAIVMSVCEYLCGG